jgi:hypothetical protein
MVDAPVVPISPVIAVEVPWFVMPAPPPKTAKVEATPRFGAAATAAFALPKFPPMGILQAATKAANIRMENPPRTFFVNDFIILYLLVQILYINWLIVKLYLHI